MCGRALELKQALLLLGYAHFKVQHLPHRCPSIRQINHGLTGRHVPFINPVGTSLILLL
jgi:hypothetical protein